MNLKYFQPALAVLVCALLAGPHSAWPEETAAALQGAGGTLQPAKPLPEAAPLAEGDIMEANPAIRGDVNPRETGALEQTLGLTLKGWIDEQNRTDPNTPKRSPKDAVEPVPTR